MKITPDELRQAAKDNWDVSRKFQEAAATIDKLIADIQTAGHHIDALSSAIVRLDPCFDFHEYTWSMERRPP